MIEENKQNDTLSEYQKYFQNDIDALDDEIKKSKEYRTLIDKEIDVFTGKQIGGPPTKGGQHYLIEHLKNAIALQSQTQSLLKDKVSLKKIIMDYSEKATKNDEGSDSIQKELMRLSENQKKLKAQLDNEKNNKIQDTNVDIDAEIEKQIKESEENGTNN